MLQLARRVQGVDVHDRHAGAQDAEQRHRILQQVRRHDGDAVALGHARQALQERGEVARQPRELRIADRAAEVVIGRPVGEFAKRLLEHVRDGREQVGVDLGRHADRIVLEPDSVRHARPRLLPYPAAAAIGCHADEPRPDVAAQGWQRDMSRRRRVSGHAGLVHRLADHRQQRRRRRDQRQRRCRGPVPTSSVPSSSGCRRISPRRSRDVRRRNPRR